jgi:hypothetical protein
MSGSRRTESPPGINRGAHCRSTKTPSYVDQKDKHRIVYESAMPARPLKETRLRIAALTSSTVSGDAGTANDIGSNLY